MSNFKFRLSLTNHVNSSTSFNNLAVGVPIFHASNRTYNFHSRLLKPIRYLLMSPSLHWIHHSKNVKLYNSNYSVVFSFWDRIFGTYKKFDRDKLIYGVDVFFNEEKNGRIYDLLKQHFQKYKKPSETKI